MKTIYLKYVFLLGLVYLLPACKKAETNYTYETIKESLKQTETYYLPLGVFGDEEGASISKQAAHFRVSQLSRDLNTGKISFVYEPAANFVGTDVVEIKSTRGSNGSSANNIIQVTTLKFTVSP